LAVYKFRNYINIKHVTKQNTLKTLSARNILILSITTVSAKSSSLKCKKCINDFVASALSHQNCVYRGKLRTYVVSTKPSTTVFSENAIISLGKYGNSGWQALDETESKKPTMET
jgi:hypothetical protein